MKNRDLFLVDEISLADDIILERLNSVSWSQRGNCKSLAEKGGSDLEKITAHEKFFIHATMNPGGDFALEKISNPEILFVADAMINFWKTYLACFSQYELGLIQCLSQRWQGQGQATANMHVSTVLSLCVILLEDLIETINYRF
ncbi:hypothetical protein Tco_0169135 [Tanacetum coccineum]